MHVKIPRKILQKCKKNSLLHFAVEKVRSWFPRLNSKPLQNRKNWDGSKEDLEGLNNDIILTKLLDGAETLKGSIYVASISLVEQPTVDIWFSRWFINSKIYRCLYFFGVNGYEWSEVLFVIFKLSLMTGSLVVEPSLEGSF